MLTTHVLQVSELLVNVMDQWCTYPEHNFTQMTKHYIVVHNICGFSECSLLHVILLAPILLMWLLDLNIIGVYPLTGTTGMSLID
jgi:hypothetical protein